MKILISSVVGGFLVMTTCSQAFAFGRGGVSMHAAPHFAAPAFHPASGGARFAWHGVAGGAIGGVHGFNAAHFGGVPHLGGVPHIGGVPHLGGFEHIGGVEHVGGVAHAVEAGHGAVTGAIGGVHHEIGSVGGLHGTGIGRGEWGRGLGDYRGGYAFRGGGWDRGFGTHYFGRDFLRGFGARIRGYEYPYFTRNWFGLYPGAWLPGFWAGGLGFWDVPYWDTLAPFVGITAAPILYDYGSTVLINDGSVYQDGTPVGTVQQHADQAFALVAAGRAAMPGPDDQWQPLGVFGLVQGSESSATRIFQLAIDKAGIVRGNYYDAVADTNQPVYGAADLKTQQVAWSVGDRKDVAYEAGLDNLLQNETTCLIFYGRDRTKEMILVRLPPPPQAQTQQPQKTPPPR